LFVPTPQPSKGTQQFTDIRLQVVVIGYLSLGIDASWIERVYLLITLDSEAEIEINVDIDSKDYSSNPSGPG
jgi:hypothetical protein